MRVRRCRVWRSPSAPVKGQLNHRATALGKELQLSAPARPPSGGGTPRAACPVPAVGQVRPPPGAQVECTLFYAPFGPACGRPVPLWPPSGASRARRARARRRRGKRPPAFRPWALSCSPGRMACGHRPAFARCSLQGPGRHRPGPSGPVLRSSSATGRPRASRPGPPSPWQGFLCRRLLHAQGLAAPLARPGAVSRPLRKGQGQETRARKKGL